jgi:hypothetical protein
MNVFHVPEPHKGYSRDGLQIGRIKIDMKGTCSQHNVDITSKRMLLYKIGEFINSLETRVVDETVKEEKEEEKTEEKKEDKPIALTRE